MDELETQRMEITAELADLKLAQSVHLTKEKILFFLRGFRDMDLDERGCQKRLIDTFVNSVFVYEDKVTIAFNYSGDGNTVTLKDIDSADEEVFVSCCGLSTKKQ